MAQRLTVPLPPTFLDTPGEPRIRWSNWVCQLENFFTLTNLTLVNELTDRAKNAYLSTLLGCEGSRILMAHPAGGTAATATYTEFKASVQALFERPVDPVRAEFEFRCRKQGATESVCDYLTALRTLHAEREHVAELTGDVATKVGNRDLAMQLAIGCHNRQTQEKLLQETDISLDNFIRIMQSAETVSLSSATINHAPASLAAVSKEQATSHRAHQKTASQELPKTKAPRQCNGCGQSGHCFKSSTCPALGKKCSHCGKINHFAKVCLQKRRENKVVRMLQVANATTTGKTPTVITNLVVQCGQQKATLQFMVDTGADISTINQSAVKQFFANCITRPAAAAVHNYDGSTLKEIRGVLPAAVHYKGKTTTASLYIVSDALPAIAGRDLIRALELYIDGASLKVHNITATPSSILSTVTASCSLSCHQLAIKFPLLFDNRQGTYPDYQHVITVSDNFRPFSTKFRPVALAKRAAITAEVQSMIDSGIWSPIDKSECTHAMVVVGKKDGGVRITTDLSPLNKFVIPDRHPLPHIEDLLLKLRGQSYFSKLDLRKGYYNIRLDDKSRRYTATITPLGLMAYNRLPMGLTDAASAFQKCVTKTLASCANTIAFMDDILVYGSSESEHNAALQKVLTALQEKQFRLNTAKCLFGVHELNFLGFHITPAGIHPSTDKIAPIKEAPHPTTLKQLQSFLGAVNYLSIFLPGLADKAEPLRALTRKGAAFQWTDLQEQAFQALKDAITADLQLAIYDPDAQTFVTVDASDVGLGAQLSQIQNGREVPVQFASHTLAPRERNFATNEKEALGCVWATEHWEKFLLGHHFTLRTDHGPLLSLLTQHSAKRKSAKFERWLERLSRFDYKIEYIKGERNCIADALSRLPRPAATQPPTPAISEGESPKFKATIAAITSGPISLDSIREHTTADSLLQQVKEYLHNTWPVKKAISAELQAYYNVRNELSMAHGCIVRSNHRFVIPVSLQQRILHVAHEGHPGIVRAKRQLRSTYWWPGLDTQVEEFIKHCLACQDSNKAHKISMPPNSPIPKPTEPWHKVALDISGPFAIAPRHQRFVTTIIDYATGYPEILLSDDITSGRLIKWLTEVFARFGNPAIAITDNGRQFVSDEFTNFLRSRDIQQQRTAVYNPQQNGRVEAFNRYLKHGTQTFNSAKKEFAAGIQELLFSYRATSATPGGSSPAELFLGRRIRTNAQPAIRSRAAESHSTMSTQPEQPVSQRQPALPLFRGPYQRGDLVRVRLPHVPKGCSPFSEPRRVLEVLGNYTYRLSDSQIWNARRLVRHRVAPQQTILVEGNYRNTHRTIRRSTRKTRGHPPVRFPYHGGR